MDLSKIIGWLVFLAGLAIIGWTLVSSYNIFTGQSDIPQLFESPAEVAEQRSEAEGLEAQFQEMIGEQLRGLIPFDSFSKILNLTVWSILAFILIFGGAQIAGLGVKLIKK